MRVSSPLAVASCAATVVAEPPGQIDATYNPFSVDVKSTMHASPETADASTMTETDSAASLSILPVSPTLSSNTNATTSSLTSSSSLSTSSQTFVNTLQETTLQTTPTSEDSNSPVDATGSQPADATGGAILQQMQGSMAGLLGFCIMSLIML